MERALKIVSSHMFGSRKEEVRQPDTKSEAQGPRDADSSSQDGARTVHHERARSRTIPPSASKHDTSGNELDTRVTERIQPSRSTKVAIPNVQGLLAKREQELRHQRLEFEKLEGEHRNLRFACGQLCNENEALLQSEKYYRTIYSHVTKKYIKPYAEHTGVQYNEHDEKSIKQILGHMLRDALEATPLRQQVQSLQKEMLSKVEKVQALSDDELAQEFRALASAIKSFSRKIRLTSDIDIPDMLGTPLLLTGVSSHHWKGRARKWYIEAWVWAIVLYGAFRHPFAVFGRECDVLHNVWNEMFGAPYCHDQSYPTASSEAWRFTTVERLVEMVGEELVTNGIPKEGPHHTNEKTVRDLEASVIAARKQTLSDLETGLSLVCTAIDASQIRDIVDKAYALALRFALQRARVQITYPSIGVDFNKEEMLPMQAADGEDIEDGVVLFIVNPGLTKWGDAHAKNLDQRYDVVPSLVQLEAHPAVIEVETYSDVVKMQAKSE